MLRIYSYKTFFCLSALCLLTAGILIWTDADSGSGILLVAAVVLLALGFRRYAALKGYTYTMMVIAAVIAAMFYPQYFITVGDFRLDRMITPLLQIIMFGMGTAMSAQDFIGIIRMPKGVIVGTLNHFTIMPLLGFTLASIFDFPPEIAAGVILIGCSPCGMASNVISYLARANLALSITLTTVSTFLAPILTPLLMKLLAGQFIEIDVVKMVWDITKIVILPVGAGLLFNHLLKGKVKWLDEAMPLLSMAGIGFIILIITAAGRGSLLEIGIALIASSLIHNTAGYFLGYWSARLFRMQEQDCRTIAIEVGMQNGGLASGIAREMGKLATVGLAPAIFGPLMNITGSMLATWWRGRLIEDDEVRKVEETVRGKLETER
ncbi:bile acid:sodium symporter family protein [Ohtaekwangia kribbensis]|uniref:Bile acid:sodium symporter family protein n=1 Tax=Ohtaekwangia kribbensis TaxID=688913 RepID=A0ABW3JYA2_9BACT